jgi:hypothetical protein
MDSRSRIATCCLLVGIVAGSRSTEAAGRVRLEIFTDERAPITSQQQWLRQLSAAGVTNFRIHAGEPTDKVGVEVQGTEADPLYLVSGMITSGNELVLPGGRFRPSDAPQVARWLKNLAEKGVRKEEPRGPFGLTEGQFRIVQKDLAQPVGFSTKGLSRAQAVEKIGGRLAAPPRIEPGALDADSEDKLAEELSSVACGTALACVLRPAGLGLLPRVDDGGQPEYAVVRAKRDMEIWPVGWPPEKPLPQVIPTMYESLNANIQDVSLSTALGALSKRLKVPFLFDHNALARHEIDPDKKKVNSPQSKITYQHLLRKILSQAGLKSEVRIDEAGKPLVWITTVKPL